MRAVLEMGRRERHVVVLGALVAIGGLLVGRVIPAWHAWTREERALAAKTADDLRAARLALDSAPALLDTLISRSDRYVALAPVLVAGETPAAAGIALMSIVSGAAAGAGLRPGPMHLRVDTARTSVFARIAIRGSAEGDVRGLSQFLLAVERGPTLLSIRHLAVSQPDPGAGPDKPEAIRIEFTIAGLALDPATVRGRSATPSAIVSQTSREIP